MLKIEHDNLNIIVKDNEAPPLFKDSMESNNLENNIKCTECELIFDSVEKMSYHFYEAHEKNIIEKSKLNKECNMNMKKIEVNENAKKEEELERQKELEREEELKRQEDLKKEELKKQEELKKEEALKKEDELKRQEELKIQEEKKGEEDQEELKKKEDQEELKKEEEMKKQEDLKREEELKKQNEFKIVNHNYSKKNKPSFKCSICGKKFSSRSSLIEHEKSKTKKHKFENYYGNYYYDNYQNYYYDNYYYNKCKTCGKTFNSSYALRNHCKDKKH